MRLAVSSHHIQAVRSFRASALRHDPVVVPSAAGIAIHGRRRQAAAAAFPHRRFGLPWTRRSMRVVLRCCCCCSMAVAAGIVAAADIAGIAAAAGCHSAAARYTSLDRVLEVHGRESRLCRGRECSRAFCGGGR